MNAPSLGTSHHWIATRLAEPWEAPSFGAAGKLNREARRAVQPRKVTANPKSDGRCAPTRVRSPSAAASRR